MPAKRQTKQEEVAPAPAPAVEDKKTKKSASTKKEEVAAPAKSASKKSESKKSESTKKEAKPEAKKAPKAAASSEKKEKVKREVDKETVHADFLSLEQRFKETLKSLSGDNKRAVAEIFRSFVDLRKDSSKILKIKSKRQNNGDGGFKKGVKISDALSKFCQSNSASVLKFIEKDIAAGKASGKASKWELKDYSGFKDWAVDKEHGRDKVTNFICGYISDKNLQNPKCRKELIFDTPLQQLFGLKSADKYDEKPITYCTIQTLLKQHYPETPKKDAKK